MPALRVQIPQVDSDVDSNGSDVEPAGARVPPAKPPVDPLVAQALQQQIAKSTPAAHVIDESDEDDEYDHDFEDD